MAIIKTRNIGRPNNISGLFGNLNISLNNFNITSAPDLLSRANITDFPVDLNVILRLLGLTLVYQKLENDISGVLDVRNNTITVEACHPEQRQRFTIAHEIAHFCLHQSKEDLFEDKIFFRGVDINSLEYQANEFAGELLMPEDVFYEQIRQGNKSIERLATHFGVSTLAIRVRARNLGLTGHGL
jgi:Zn-dependent peptidase ImmA (M78 family)